MRKLFVELNGTVILRNSGMTYTPSYDELQLTFEFSIFKCSCMLEEKRIWLLGAKMFRIVESSRIKLRPFAMKATEAVSSAIA
jgi:hypothetical protein